MRKSAAIQHIRHIASAGLAPHAAVADMIDVLEEVIPSRICSFLWSTPDGAPTDIYTPEFIPSAFEELLARGPALAQTSEVTIDKIIRAPVDHSACQSFAGTAAYERSTLRNTLFAAYGIGNILDMTIRDGGTPRGIVTVNREPGSAAFNAQEVADLLSLRAYFLHAMDGPGTDLTKQAAGQGDLVKKSDAMLLCDDNGVIIDATPRAIDLLRQMGAGLFVEREPALVPGHRLPASVVELVRAAGDPTIADAPASGLYLTRSGAVRVRVHALQSSGLFTVSLREQVARRSRQLARLARLDLSPGERRLALGLCSPDRTGVVADAMGLTVGSCRQYTQRIYRKLRVGSRAALAEMLGH